jgi:hypothetical protein
VEPGNQWLPAQVKAGAFMDILTLIWVRVKWALFIGPGFMGSLRWSGLFAPYWGERETNLIAFCSWTLWHIYETLYLFFRVQIYTSFSGCRNADLCLLLRMRNHSALHGDEILTHLPFKSPDPTNPLWDKYPTTIGDRGDDSSNYFMLAMGQQGGRGCGSCLRGWPM